MNFSEFSKRLYPCLSGLSNQGQFIGALFNAAGSTFFPLRAQYGTDDYQRKVYSGQRPFNSKMKCSFPSPIDNESLMNFLDLKIGDSSLQLLMRNFGIPMNEVQNKGLFIKALCIQFQNIISETSDEVEDVVASEYNRLLLESDTLAVNDGPYYPGDDFLLVGQIPEQNHIESFYKEFEHQWTIRNTGTVTWEGRYLECTNPTDIKIRSKNKIIDIPKVKPGDEVCLTVKFNSRGCEGNYKALWEMKDVEGHSCFPFKKSLAVEVVVENKRSVTLEA